MSIIADFQVSALAPSVVSANSSAAQYFPRLLGTSIGVQSVAPSATSAAGQLVVPGNSAVDGKWFSILVGANATANGASTNVTFLVRANTGTVASPSYTTLATTGAVALNPTVDPASANVAFKIDLFGSTKSGIVGGRYLALFNNTAESSSPVAIPSSLSGISFAGALPFGVVVSATFSTADATNTASLTQFQIAAD